MRIEKKIDKEGYIKIKMKGHPRADKEGYIFEHIWVIERFFDIILPKNHCVHHIDENKQNNKIENLWVFPSQKEHMKYHIKLKKFPYLTQPMRTAMNQRYDIIEKIRRGQC